ncbi:ParG domain-containing protein [Rhizoctonia solani AG-1 IA]|uniref:ParG domain-containing protein n=1 Tax=Thanatephorus cucumeris (strain AG1-IA) TaxID=983506 RepID=L8WIR8_THACA|nr:ParG domain-containing protein [Rhizoctonia solani AG-1 IA]
MESVALMLVSSAKNIKCNGIPLEKVSIKQVLLPEALALDYPLAPVTTYQPAGSSLASSANWPNFQRAPVLQQYANASSSTYARKGRFPAGSRYMSNSLLGCTSTAPVGFTELSASHERINIYSGGSYVWSHASASEPIADPESDNENDELENFQEAVTRTIALSYGVRITSWARVFIFEPARITLTLRDAVAQRHWSEEKAYERMLMIADVMGAISKSTNYNLESFIRLYKHATSRLRAAQLALEQNELTRQLAMDAMTIFPGVSNQFRLVSLNTALTNVQLISVTCKVGSLVMVLKMMNMYAPVFRCACPESSKELANLPRILMAPEIELKYFVTLDVLLSLITHRPMFFRYDLDFYSSEVEDLINSSHGPGLRWSHGLPDRLTVVLSGFSTILEQAIGISSEQVEELEAEIDKCQVIITPESVLNPDLMIGRIAVQEMMQGLCGADCTDERVVKIQTKCMLLLGGIKPRRNPDSFLIPPLLVIGLASPSPKDRSVILSRLWGVAECKKQGTMANDMVRILNDIWTQTTERPAVWADLRPWVHLGICGAAPGWCRPSIAVRRECAIAKQVQLVLACSRLLTHYYACRGKTCDGIRASTGCLQCAQVGIKSLDYSSTTDVTFQSTEGFLPALVNWPTTRGAPVPQQHANSYLPAYAPRGRIPGRAQYVSDSLAEYITAAPAGLKRHPASPGHTYTSSSENDAWSCVLQNEDENEELKNFQEVLTKFLAPSRKAKSNALPFAIQSFAAWARIFVFEPARIAFVLREAMSQRHWPEEETHERVVLVADTMAVVSKSTNYDLTTFIRLYQYASNRLQAARLSLKQDSLTRQAAIEVMNIFHVLTCITCKVGSLITVLNMMDMYAPVFRRACSESSKELANLPRILMAPEIDLKYFATLDVLLGAITRRPMFFRYDLDFYSSEVEGLIDSDYGPGLRWSHGLPDRLTVVLAKFNTMLEQAVTLNSGQVEELEADIDKCEAIIAPESELNPDLMIGRITVQEVWKYAAHIYLLMVRHSYQVVRQFNGQTIQGLCGADCTDERVVKIQTKCMLLLGGIKPRRNSDLFLIPPLLIIGLASPSPKDRSAILSRLWGVAECKKQGTMANDMVRMLNDIWTQTTERPGYDLGRPWVHLGICSAALGRCRPSIMVRTECAIVLSALVNTSTRHTHPASQLPCRFQVTLVAGLVKRGEARSFCGLTSLKTVYRNKICDSTWGPAGCRRCAEDGLDCRRRIPRLKNSVREVGATNTGRAAHHDCAVFALTTSTPINPGPSRDVVTCTIAPVGPSTSRSRGHASTTPSIHISQIHDISQHSYGSLAHEQPYISSTQGTGAFSSRQTVVPIRQVPTPPAETIDSPRESTIPIQLSIVCSPIHDSTVVQPLTPESPGFSANTRKERGSRAGSAGDFQLQAGSAICRPGSPLNYDVDDPENIRVISWLCGDQFITHFVFTVTAAAVRFVFAPTLIVSNIRTFVSRSRALGQEARQRMLLIANMALAISSTTDYDLTHYVALQEQLISSVVYARKCQDLNREVAERLTKEQLLSTMWRVGSLANILSTMQLYAPIFRCACPESTQELVNFPRLLIMTNLNLQYYAALDILQSFLTQRPMFFRYDLDQPSPQVEQLINSDHRLGLWWRYGIPNRLMLIFAQMNNLFEDFGNLVGQDKVKLLEDDIGACTPLLPSDTDTEPILNMGRVMVQESWKLAAYVYLYMGLCGADSSDARVVQVRKRFIRALKGIKPGRNPDTFLVFPMAILGITTSSPKDQAALLNRFWGVPECAKPGTVGNDMVMMLRDVWLRTQERPAVWADFRMAYSRVVGV